MLLGLKRSISMRFQRQKHQPDRRSLALERRIKALALDWIGARIVVRLAMDQQNRRLDLIRIAERRHIEVQLRILPVSPLLVLESIRSQRTFVSPPLAMPQ